LKQKSSGEGITQQIVIAIKVGEKNHHQSIFLIDSPTSEILYRNQRAVAGSWLFVKGKIGDGGPEGVPLGERK
jgi:hypothetical protein